MLITYRSRFTLNWWSRRAVEDAIVFYLETMGVSKSLHKNTIIEISASNYLARGGYEGYVQEDTYDPNELHLFVRKGRKMMQNLAHECVHVKQLLTTELVWSDRSNNAKWLGRNWKPGVNQHNYFDAPWEIEAYGRELGLYMRWRWQRPWTKRILDRLMGVC